METKKEVKDLTLAEFMDLPARAWSEEVECDAIIILPTQQEHDSGYMCMDFVAIKDNEAVCRLSGHSDVIHVNGIGGFGVWSPQTGIPSSLPPVAWSIDCLPTSGLLRLWASGWKLKCGPALSSFELFAVRK